MSRDIKTKIGSVGFLPVVDFVRLLGKASTSQDGPTIYGSSVSLECEAKTGNSGFRLAIQVRLSEYSYSRYSRTVRFTETQLYQLVEDIVRLQRLSALVGRHAADGRSKWREIAYQHSTLIETVLGPAGGKKGAYGLKCAVRFDYTSAHLMALTFSLFCEDPKEDKWSNHVSVTVALDVDALFEVARFHRDYREFRAAVRAGRLPDVSEGGVNG